MALVVGALVTGVTLAGQSHFSHIQTQAKGDDRVVATISNVIEHREVKFYTVADAFLPGLPHGQWKFAASFSLQPCSTV